MTVSRTRVVATVIVALIAVLIYDLVLSGPIEKKVFGSSVGIAHAEVGMCTADEPCSTTSTPQWQRRYRHHRLGSSHGGVVPPRILRMVKRAWVRRHNAQSKTMVSTSDFCAVSGYSFLCQPLPTRGCVLSSYVCKPKPRSGRVIDNGINWSQVDRVTFHCGVEVLFGGLGGALTSAWVGMFVGAGVGASHCAVDETAKRNDWW